MNKAKIESFFDESTATVSHVLWDSESRNSAIIDSVLDFQASAGLISYQSADSLITYVRDNKLHNQWILETHVHADHLSAAPYLKQKIGGEIGIGGNIPKVQQAFATLFDSELKYRADPGDFDRLFAEGDNLKVGTLDVKILETPGHTPACISYLVENNAFIGDTLFMPDYGTARCDFPGGNAAELYRSVQNLYELPDDTNLYLCHDYLTGDRTQHKWQTTVGEQKSHNIHINYGVSEEEFVAMRSSRDKELAVPELIIPAIQVNIRAGNLPVAESNGIQYLKIPINSLEQLNSE